MGAALGARGQEWTPLGRLFAPGESVAHAHSLALAQVGGFSAPPGLV